MCVCVYAKCTNRQSEKTIEKAVKKKKNHRQLKFVLKLAYFVAIEFLKPP